MTSKISMRAPAWLRRWAYWPAVSHPTLRRLLPGYGLSALGDGMSAVAISWLALQIAPPASRGLWVGAALAAYALPGAVGMYVLGGWLRRHGWARLATADAVLRAVALGSIPVLAALGLLTPPVYVGVLAASSLLHVWGLSAQFTLVAEVLPPQDRVAGNGLMGITTEISMIGGPALAGLVTALAGPAAAIAVDAATFAVLAASYVWAAPLIGRPGRPAGPADADQAAGGGTQATGQGGWRVIGASPTLLGLLGLTLVFYGLYGPVEVALPVRVAVDLHGSAAMLGAFWTAFSVGAVIGNLAAPAMRRWPVWPTMIAIVVGWALALAPLALGAPLWACLGGFAAGGLIYAPYTPLSISVFQDASPPDGISSVLAARASVVLVAAPLGAAIGGPLVAALGAGGTLLASAAATLALAALAAAALAWRRSHELRGPGPATDQT